MARRQTKVGFTASDLEFIAGEAQAAGETFAQFVRAAALGRAWVSLARRQPGAVRDLEALFVRAGEMADESARRVA